MFDSFKTERSVSFLMLMLLAYGFSIAIRMIWVYQFSGEPSFYWNDHIMINTNDGYAYAEGARDMLAGFHQDNDLSYYGTALSSLTYLLAKVLPFSLETIILYMPAFMGSLLIVPVMLIARIIKQELAGFIAALLASITWSYYNRTMTGYYDTDMLTIVLPSLILWSLIFNIEEQKNRYLLLIPVLIIAYSWWYVQSYSLNLAMAFTVFFYTLLFDRKNLFNYKILIFMLIAMSYFPWTYKLVAAFALFLAFHLVEKANSRQIIFSLLAAVLLLILVTGGLDPVLAKLKAYVFREAIAGELMTNLQFYGVAQTVREAGQIPFEVFANRISGHPVTFLFSLIGYLLMAFRYRVMWLALPMLGLGFLALQGGLRFTVYAVPVMALGMGYLIVWSAGLFDRLIQTPRTLTSAKRLYIIGLSFAVLYPNIIHIINYRVPTVFNTSEVKVLDALGKIADREDYVMTWWDYGYPIRYYSDVKTLVDGGKHTGDVNYPVSLALSAPQKVSAAIARLNTEYAELAFEHNRSGSYIQMMMEDNGLTDPSDFLDALASDQIKIPAKTREVFYYLPFRMLDIYPTVKLFSSIDLSSGQQKQRDFLYSTSSYKDHGTHIDLGRGVVLNKQKSVIELGDQSIPVSTLLSTKYDEKGKLVVNTTVLNPLGKIYVIFMRDYNRFLVMDANYFASVYIQMFVLEKYDETLFEPVIVSPLAKVYRLKH